MASCHGLRLPAAQPRESASPRSRALRSLAPLFGLVSFKPHPSSSSSPSPCLFSSNTQLDAWRGGNGGFELEQREQQNELAAKVRSQDLSLRSLRADVTTLRRILNTQAETMAKQKEENEVMRTAAEQVGTGGGLWRGYPRSRVVASVAVGDGDW